MNPSDVYPSMMMPSIRRNDRYSLNITVDELEFISYVIEDFDLKMRKLKGFHKPIMVKGKVQMSTGVKFAEKDLRYFAYYDREGPRIFNRKIEEVLPLIKARFSSYFI